MATAAAPAEVGPVRTRLPKRRPATVTRFSVGGAEGYMTASTYPDNGLGEVFLKLGKQGSTLAGVMDAFSMAISISLQYGVPLETWVDKFTNMRFEPAGMTDDPDIRMANSMMDYIFRRLALDHLPYDDAGGAGHLLGRGARPPRPPARTRPRCAPRRTSTRRHWPSRSRSNARRPESQARPARRSPTPRRNSSRATRAARRTPRLCLTCGTKMRPAGSCYVCEGCGSTSGCS